MKIPLMISIKVKKFILMLNKLNCMIFPDSNSRFSGFPNINLMNIALDGIPVVSINAHNTIILFPKGIRIQPLLLCQSLYQNIN